MRWVGEPYRHRPGYAKRAAAFCNAGGSSAIAIISADRNMARVYQIGTLAA